MKVEDFFNIFNFSSDGYFVIVCNYHHKNTRGSDFEIRLNRKNFMYNILDELEGCEYEITSITLDNNDLVIKVDFPEDIEPKDWRAKCLI